MQWIGALLCIGATTWAGFDISFKLNARPRQIRQMKNSLQILEAEIIYSQLALPDVFESIANQIPEPLQSFFHQLSVTIRHENKELYNIWEETLDAWIKRTSLSHNEKEILLQFGRTLGQHDFDQQEKHIQLTFQHLDRELEEARDNQFKYGKMAKSLGLLSGLFIVLLLL